jgi:hypothetical protein
MDVETSLPLVGSAIEHPGTGQALRRARLWVLTRTGLWLVGALVVAVGMGFLAEPSASDGPLTKVGSLVAGLLLVFVFVPGVLVGVGSLLRLRGIRKILREYAWEARPAVRRIEYVKELAGIPVTIENAAGEDEWGKVMVVRSAIRSNRWDRRMEKGAWFAGDVPLGGVVALPGGAEPMKIHSRGGRDRREDMLSARGDLPRIKRAKAAGLWG